MTDSNLQNKEFVILTGASGGIGFSVLMKLASLNYNVVAIYNKENEIFLENCRALSNQFNVLIIPFRMNITNKDDRLGFSRYLLKEEINPSALINNAGFASGSLFHMTSENLLRENFEVNFFGNYFFTQLISKIMIKHGRGSIVFVTSVTADNPTLGTSAYGASKAALSFLTKSLSLELAPYNIRVNEVSPGLTDTRMLKNMDEKNANLILERTALSRVAVPLEIANAILFLIHPESSYINGTKIEVDGGYL